MFLEKVRRIWNKKLIDPQNVGIEVNENGKNGRGGKARIARGQVGVCTGEVGIARGQVGIGQGILGDCGWFLNRGGVLRRFFRKSARKWVPCGEVGVGFCTMARNGRFSEGNSDVVSCRPSPSVFGLRRFLWEVFLSAAWPSGSYPAFECSPRGSGRCPRSCGPPERC